MRNTYRFWSGVLAGLVVCVAASPLRSQGAVIYTDLGAFTGNLASGNYYTGFEAAETPSWTAGNQGSGSVALSGGSPSFGFTIATSWDNLWVANGTLPSGQALSTRLNSDGVNPVDLIITFTSGNVTAVGANFFLSNVGGSQTAGTLDLVLSDGTLITDLGSPASGAVPFRGFTTANGVWITSLALHPDAAVPNPYITLDNLYVGAAVPEPSTWFAAGFVGLVVVGRYGRNLFARLGMRH